MKRILLFIATNLAVVLVLGIVLNLIFSFTGLTYGRNNYTSLLVLAAVFGFGGSFISR
jgi:heat shock protein HtpX